MTISHFIHDVISIYHQYYMETNMGILERREREKQQRRNDILDAAEKIFFSKGWDVATMDEVAGESELSKGTLYLYFKNKEDLLFGIAQRGLKIMTEMFTKAVEIPAMGLDKVHAVGRAYIEFTKKYQKYIQIMTYCESHTPDTIKGCPNAEVCQNQGHRALNILADAIQTGINDGSISPDVSPQKTALVLYGQTAGILQLFASKKKHTEKLFSEHGFKNMQDIIDYAFEMTRKALIASR